MLYFLKDSLLGNIIGIISLIVGVVSLFFTIITMKSAKRIEKDIMRARVETLDKKRFKDHKKTYIKALEKKRAAVLKESILSYSICNDIISIIHDLVGYKNVLSQDDMDLLKEQKSRLNNINKNIKEKNNTVIDIQEFDEIIAIVINILSKGEYEL